MFLKIFYLLFIFLFSLSSYGKILIIQSSDHHSAYKRMPEFLGSIENLSRQFKKQNPNGQVVLLINGDFSSLNSWTNEDRGNFGYKVLRQLSKKYLTIFTFGNHDSFDWKDSDLFLEQMGGLKKAGARLLITNVKFYPEYDHLFQSFVDLPLNNNQFVRFLGFTLSSSKFFFQDKKVISSFLQVSDTAKRVLSEANSNPAVAKVILNTHIASHRMRNTLTDFNSSELEKVNLVFTAHDHKEAFSQVGGLTQMVNSGAYFKFSTIVLDGKGQVVSKKFFDYDDQRELFKKMDPNSLEASLFEKVKSYLKYKRRQDAKYKLKKRTNHFNKTRTITQRINKKKPRPCRRVFAPAYH